MTVPQPRLTIVLPLYNERDNLAPLLAEIATAFAAVPYEVVAVDDGSTDGSGDRLRALTAEYPTLRVFAGARRMGQSGALCVGFEAARGVAVLTMDADGQNPPAEGLRLWEAWSGSATEAVVGYRVRRADGRWRRVQSGVARAVRTWLTGDRVRDTGCSLKVMPTAVVRRLPRFDGMHRFLPTLLRREGLEVRELPVGHRPRWSGRSKYGMVNRIGVGLGDALGVRWLVRRGVTGVAAAREVGRTD